MSVWVVSKGHIDCIVQSLVVEGVIQIDQATIVGRSLWLANRESFLERYEGRHARDNVSLAKLKAYRFEGIEAPLNDAIVYWEAQCWEYQCDEWSGFAASAQLELVRQLADRIEARRAPASVGHFRDYSIGNDDWVKEYNGGPKPPWGLNSIEQAVLSEVL